MKFSGLRLNNQLLHATRVAKWYAKVPTCRTGRTRKPKTAATFTQCRVGVRRDELKTSLWASRHTGCFSDPGRKGACAGSWLTELVKGIWPLVIRSVCLPVEKGEQRQEEHTEGTLQLLAGGLLLGSLAVTGSGQQKQQRYACVESPEAASPKTQFS